MKMQINIIFYITCVPKTNVNISVKFFRHYMCAIIAFDFLTKLNLEVPFTQCQTLTRSRPSEPPPRNEIRGPLCQFFKKKKRIDSKCHKFAVINVRCCTTAAIVETNLILLHLYPYDMMWKYRLQLSAHYTESVMDQGLRAWPPVAGGIEVWSRSTLGDFSSEIIHF